MLKTFSITDIGRKRKVNQDYIYTSEKPVGNLPNVFIVADGMGGHNAGDYASKVTVETMLAEMENSFEKNPTLIFRKAIEEANDVIRKRASEDEKLEGMGTTVVVASCMGRFLQVANVGDSRLYVVGSKIRQITRDHSYVEEMVRIGELDRADARNHPDKNIITRAVGAEDKVEPDFFTVELQEGEIVLMCSDKYAGRRGNPHDYQRSQRPCGEGREPGGGGQCQRRQRQYQCDTDRAVRVNYPAFLEMESKYDQNRNDDRRSL